MKSEKSISVHIDSVRFADFFLILLICNKQHDQTENLLTVRHILFYFISFCQDLEGN